MGYVFTLLVVLLPVLGQVALPFEIPFVTENISLGVLLLLPFLVVYLCDKWPVKGISALRPVGLGGTAAFFVAFSVIAILGVSFFDGNLPALIGYLLPIMLLPILILSARGNFRVSYGMTAYIFFAFSFSIYLIWQYVLLKNGYGYMTDGFLSASYIFKDAVIDRFTDTGNPASFFLSPNGFALYVLPALAYLLLWNRNGYRAFSFIGGFVISVAIFLSTSSVGIVLALGIWIVYLILPTVYFLLHPADAVYRFLHGGAPRIILTVVTFVICTTLISLYLIDGSAKAVLVPAFGSVFGAQGVMSGFSALSQLLVGRRKLLFGVGFGNLDQAFAAIGESVPALSMVGELLLTFGLLGFGVFALLLAGLLFRARGKFGFSMSVLLILLSTVSSYTFVPIFAFWFFLTYSVGKTEMPFRRYMRVEY